MCCVNRRKRTEKEALNILWVYFLIIQQLLMRLKQANIGVLQGRFDFIMEKALWCLGEVCTLDSCSTKEADIRIKFQDPVGS